jgi:hypothetical protein
MEAIKGTCEFEPMDANDLLSAIGTLSSHSRLSKSGVLHDKIGDGFERFLARIIHESQTRPWDSL